MTFHTLCSFSRDREGAFSVLSWEGQRACGNSSRTLFSEGRTVHQSSPRFFRCAATQKKGSCYRSLSRSAEWVGIVWSCSLADVADLRSGIDVKLIVICVCGFRIHTNGGSGVYLFLYDWDREEKSFPFLLTRMVKVEPLPSELVTSTLPS